MEDSSAKAVIDVVERLDITEQIEIGAVGGEGPTDLLVVSSGRKVVDLLPFHDARRENPRRRSGKSVHDTLESFLEHVARHRDSQSAIFATEQPQASFLAIYDYNEATTVRGGLDADEKVPLERGGLPRFGLHRAIYTLPFSDEWLAWQRIANPSGAWMSQKEFAEALEDRALDIIPPSDVPTKTKAEADTLGLQLGGPSTMLAVSKGLTVKADRKVGHAVNLNTGEARITFEESHTTADTAGNAMTVPPGFAISIPVFRDGTRYAFLVRLRYRLEGSALKWKVAIHRSDVALRDAFYEVARDVRTKAGLPLFYGTPES